MADTHESIQSESESNASELSLSCGSSSFEDGENVSDADSGNAETEDAGQTNNVEINPYQYEPYRNDSDDSYQDGETENTPLNRQNDTSW
jgi:hypothetical protein